MAYLSNQKDRLQWLRAEAKEHGLTFAALNLYINGKKAYSLKSRKTGLLVGSVETIDSAYGLQSYDDYFSNFA